jgi:HEAT repeat protein
MASETNRFSRRSAVKSACAVLVVACVLLAVLVRQGWGNHTHHAVDQLKNGTQDEQIDAIRTLGHQRNDPAALKALLNTLHHRDAVIRRNTVIALRNWRFTSPTGPVVEAIAKCLFDEDTYVRYCAADTLLHYFTADSLEPVRKNILPALVKHEDLLDRGGFTFIVLCFHTRSSGDEALAAATLTDLLSARRAIHRIHAMLLLDRYHEHAGSATIPALLEIVQSPHEAEAFTAALLLAKLLAERPDAEADHRTAIENLPATEPVMLLRERLERRTQPM